MRALIDASRERLSPLSGHRRRRRLADRGASRRRQRRARSNSIAARDESWHDFVGGLCATFGIGLVHLHNMSGCREGLLAAMSDARCALWLHRPRSQFRMPDDHVPRRGRHVLRRRRPTPRCAAAASPRSRHSHGIDIVAWRAGIGALLAGAAFLIAPSRWAADMLARYFPGRRVDVIPHGAPGAGRGRAGAAHRARSMLPDDDMPTVAVLGAIGPDKGARRIERLVALARERGMPRAFRAHRLPGCAGNGRGRRRCALHGSRPL